MTDLVEFLRARLDEDEAAAKAAERGPWEADAETHIDHDKTPEEWRTWLVGRNTAFTPHPGPEHDDDYAVVSYGTRDEGDGQSEANARHIARHDPARVLADIESKRRIVELHLSWAHDGTGSAEQFAERYCQTCSDGDMSWWDDKGEPDWPCLTLRLLALPYAGQPGWQEEWRPAV